MVTSRIRTTTWTSVSVLVAGALLAAAAPGAEARTVAIPALAPATAYVVPPGITSIRVSLSAAAGLNTGCDQVSGRGGAVSATIPVTPGETLEYNVGNYFAQSASGNSTDIRRAPYTLADRLVVAGGGGSNADGAAMGVNGCTGVRSGPGLGGDGGLPAGVAGSGVGPLACASPGGRGGGGGQVDGPGAGGDACGGGGPGGSGVFGHGGLGGGSGNALAPCSMGGAGGDGWYGGGGGGGTLLLGSLGGCTDQQGSVVKTVGGGGGGGSSFAVPEATNVVFQVGVNGNSFGGVGIDSRVASAPGAPASVAVTGGATSATVSWTTPTSDGGSPITGYSVTTIPGGAVLDVGTGVLSTPITGLIAGVNYSFEVTAVNAVGTGQPVSASALGTSITIRASTTAVTYGSASLLTGALSTITNATLGARSVTILGRATGATTFTKVGSATTNAAGGYVLSVKPSKGTTYLASFAGGAGLMGRSSAAVVVSVRPRVTFALNDATATRTQTVFFSGVVSPNSKLQTVYLQRLAAGKWATVRSMKLTATSAFRFAWRPTSGTDYRFRVLVPARTGYLATTTVSKLLTVA